MSLAATAKGILGVWMVCVIIGALLATPPMQGLGESGRIIYFHVPCAWIGALAYLTAAWCGFMYLRTRDLGWDCRMAAAAEIGVVFTVLATASGAIWAQAAWGRWWNWDPRQTAIFTVLLIYAALFALRMSIEQPDQRARTTAAYSLFALVAAVFLIFVAPRLPGLVGLHPSPVLPSPNDPDRGSMDPQLRAVFFASLAGFTALYFWVWRLNSTLQILACRKGAQV